MAFLEHEGRDPAREKTVFPDGSIVEMVVWKVPVPVAGSGHFYKYRLYFGRDGRRIVGFDNERGKGDHCHVADEERPYRFTTPQALIEDFLAEVLRKWTS